MSRSTLACFVSLGLLLGTQGSFAQTPAPRAKAAKAPAPTRRAAPREPGKALAPRPMPALRRLQPAPRRRVSVKKALARPAPTRRTQARIVARKAPVKRTQARPTPRPKKAPAADPKAQFSQANKLYNDGNYGEAAALFHKLAQRPGWQHFAVYYNLGNSYFRLQHYGKALAYFRKAQRLRPNDTDLLHNIQLLYKRVGKGEQDVPQLRIKSLFWYYLLNLKQLFFVVVALTYLLLLLLAVYIRRKAKDTEGTGTLRWSLAGLSTIALVLWISLGIKVYREEVRQVGVITKERISARSGYGSHFEPLFWLSEADEVLIKERVEVTGRDGKKRIWLRVEIRLLDKKKKRRIQKRGWIPGSALQRV